MFDNTNYGFVSAKEIDDLAKHLKREGIDPDKQPKHTDVNQLFELLSHYAINLFTRRLLIRDPLEREECAQEACAIAARRFKEFDLQGGAVFSSFFYELCNHARGVRHKYNSAEMRTLIPGQELIAGDAVGWRNLKPRSHIQSTLDTIIEREGSFEFRVGKLLDALPFDQNQHAQLWDAAQAINKLLGLGATESITEQQADNRKEFGDKLIAGIQNHDAYKPDKLDWFLADVQKPEAGLPGNNPLKTYKSPKQVARTLNDEIQYQLLITAISPESTILTARQKEFLALRMKGMTYEEIAEQCKCRTSNVGSVCLKANERLIEAFETGGRYSSNIRR